MKTKLLYLKILALVACMMSALCATAQQAYACYTPSNTTLTFYYDTQRSSRTGTTYDLNTGSNYTGWDTDGTNSSVTKVVFDPSFAGARPTTTFDWFYGMRNLESITDLSYLNTSEVTNMGYMFYNCESLTSLDLSSFNTSKVTFMYQMFKNCTNLRTIYVGSGWSTAAVTISAEMFSNCTSLVGGQGTTYDANHIDQTYAHIDGGPSNPGYFTEPEAYACYTPSNTTLTFYCDAQRSSRTGTTYDLNDDSGYGSSMPDWYRAVFIADVTKVVFDPSFATARPMTTHGWFYGMNNLASITGMKEYLNTTDVINMKYMFHGCTQLTSLDVSSFNTSKVEYMGWMFAYCNGLTSLDLSSFNTSKVTDMRYMFAGGLNLQTIYVGDGWNTAAVTMSLDMFKDCTSLVGGQGTTYDANHIDKTYAHIDGGPSNPGYFTEIPPEAYACYTESNTTLTFYYDDQRTSRPGTTYDLNTDDNNTSWETDGTNASVTKVVFDPSFAGARPTTTYDWFYGMGNLESITGMSYLNTSEVTNMAWMFTNCKKLTSLDVSHFNTAKVIYMGQMFSGCTGLTSLDLSSFNTSKVTHMTYMFKGCTNLQTIYVGDGWNTAAVTMSQDMFKDCTSLVGGQGTTYSSSNPKDKTYAHIDGGTSNPGYFSEKVPEAYACYTESNTTLTFYYDGIRGSRTGTTYDLTLPDGLWPGWYFDYDMQAAVTKVVFDPSFSSARPQTTYAWFSGMSNLTTITGMKEYLNTSEVTNMNDMFSGCSSLTSLDVSGFNTGNVEYMASMFAYCSSLTNLDLSNFNTSRVQFMNYMFSYCRKLKSVNLSSFNTANVLEMSGLFTECNELASVDLSSFNTAKVTNMHNMFLYCSNLTSLDVSGFNTANVTDMQDMFAVCPNLTTIYVGDEWSTAAVTPSTSMFYRSTSLVGGMGTTYDASHVDATYAHIDGGTSNPGYFTAKNAGLRGDVNGDGEVAIGDVSALIDYLLTGDPTGVNLAAANCNGDSEVSISDVSSLIDFLLNGTW